MKIPLRLLGAFSAVVVVGFLSGCVAVPADPYYAGGYSYGYGYQTGPAYVGSGGYYTGPAVVVAPPVSIGISGVFGHRSYSPGPGWRGQPGWRGHGGGHGWRGHGGGGHRGGFGGGRGHGGGRGGGHR